MPRTFKLDAVALAQARASRILAIDPRAIDSTMALSDEPASARLSTNATVAVVSILGPLAQREINDLCAYVDGYDAIERRFAKALSDVNVDAVVLRIDSPGGDAAGLLETIRRMQDMRDRSGKPVLAWADEQAGSAAYAITMVATENYLPASGEIGSIGCLYVHSDASKAYEKMGITNTIIRSGKRKAEHNSLEPLSDEARASLQEAVDAHRDQFVAVVAKARGDKPAKYVALEGAVYMGAAAVEAGLANKVWTFDAVLDRAAALGRKARKAREMKTINAKLGLSESATEAETLAAIGRIDSERVSLLTAVGKATTAEALGEISALQSNKDALAKANADLASEIVKREGLEKASEQTEVARLIAVATADRKIVPASKGKAEAMYAAHGMGALKAHLDGLVPVMPAAEVREPAHDGKGGSAESTGTGTAPTTVAKAWEFMGGDEKHNLFHSDKPGYEAARADWMKRGSPKSASSQATTAA